jgi:hypothetical protein
LYQAISPISLKNHKKKLEIKFLIVVFPFLKTNIELNYIFICSLNFHSRLLSSNFSTLIAKWKNNFPPLKINTFTVSVLRASPVGSESFKLLFRNKTFFNHNYDVLKHLKTEINLYTVKPGYNVIEEDE